MRIASWMLLLVSFGAGLACAFVVAYYAFDSKPVEVVDRGPTVKILVARKEIPKGAEIVAEDVRFVDVPVSEIPSQSITNFMQAYRRRPAYPIPAGCPICDDLLIPKQEESTDSIKYLPAGSQLVSLEIERFRFGDTLSDGSIPIANILAVGDRIDVRVVPRQEAKGEFIQRKNDVLRAFAGKAEEAGELVLENVAIHDLLSKAVEAGGRQIQSLSLLLENGEAEKLSAASREGRLRIIPHQEKERPRDDRQSAMLDETKIECPPAAQPELARSVSRIRVREVETPKPVVVGPPEPKKPVVENPVVVSAENRIIPTVDSSARRNSAHVSFVTPKHNAIRNETGDGTANKGLSENSSSIGLSPRVAERAPRTAPSVIEVGLSYDENEIFRRQAEAQRTSENYSPFGTKSRLAEQSGTAEEDAPTPPLPLRNRLQWR